MYVYIFFSLIFFFELDRAPSVTQKGKDTEPKAIPLCLFIFL